MTKETLLKMGIECYIAGMKDYKKTIDEIYYSYIKKLTQQLSEKKVTE